MEEKWATLRFNFRGVGASEGEHSGGVGEAEDAAAAVGFVAGQPGIPKDGAVLAGYSFGSMAAVMAAPKIAASARWCWWRCRSRWRSAVR